MDGEPPSIPVTTAVTSLDSANSHVGETDVVFKDAFPDLAFSHVFSNIDSVFDKIGAGSASYDWTIEGKREDGSPWELHKTNMYVSEFDLSFESAFEILGELQPIANYPNEKISFTNLEATINLEETVHDYELEKLLYCHGGSCDTVKRIRSHPGATLKFRAILKPSDGSANQKVNFRLTIPPSARGGAAVSVGGGSGCNPSSAPAATSTHPTRSTTCSRASRASPTTCSSRSSSRAAAARSATKWTRCWTR